MKAKQNPRENQRKRGCYLVGVSDQSNINCAVTPSAIREGSNGSFCIKKASTWSSEVIDFRKIEQKEVFFPIKQKETLDGGDTF